MDNNQKAKALRIVATALSELADVIDDGGDSADSPALAAGAPSKFDSLPWQAKRRAKYLQAFVDNGGQLSFNEAIAAGTAAGYDNTGSVTASGYVQYVGDYYQPREITHKGITWLEKQTGKSA